jgi:hypothetical protein
MLVMSTRGHHSSVHPTPSVPSSSPPEPVAVAQHSITMYKTPTAGVQQLQNILGAQQIKML